MCSSSSYSSWPSVQDLQNVLRGAGVLKDELSPAQAAFDWQGVIDATVSALEQQTRRVPFLADADPVVLPIVVERPSKIVSLPAPFVEITKVTIQSIGRGGSGEPVELVEEEDFDLSPLAAPLSGKPYTDLVLYPQHTRRTHVRIKVTGKRGYAAKIPAAAYQAVLDMAVARTETALQGGNKPAVESKKAGSLEIEYATTVTERMRIQNQAETSWKAAIKAFKRIQIS